MRRTPARLARRLTAPLLAGPVLAAALSLAGVADATPTGHPALALRPLPVPDTRYCAAVVGHVPGADGRSPLLGHGCPTDSRAEVLTTAKGGPVPLATDR
ncbi:hypothetical protein [Kitasatospora sp. A2-31]|uniref:hypothetical protein n=1 Tax=Kitasatospora sp. A2-31 TaxID=2916414 RepID=UPI001EEC8DA7|nr:hypothetical protein [Kitasatospora sp. A2-31]MCG6494002.1 hypothetical protein [Kitasatospora sp. A2-31]